MVDLVCKTWLVKHLDCGCACSVRLIADAVSAEDGKATSSGSVRAILSRWQEIGYAVVEEDPTRFVGLTAEGMQVGYEALYEKAERVRRESHPRDPGSVG